MPRLTKKQREEWMIFLDIASGRRSYNKLCVHCVKPCKQSFRATVIECPHYESKRSISAKAENCAD